MGVPLPDRWAVVLGGILLTVASAAPSGAADDMAIVDYQMIFDRYEGTSDAQQTLNRDLKDWDAKAKEMRDGIDTLEDEIDSQRLMLSEDRLREKEGELSNLRSEYERFAQDIWGVNGEAASRNAELTAPIAEKILDVIGQLGADLGLEVILDAGTGGVVWAKDDVNITDSVLEELKIAVRREPDEDEEEPPSAEEPPRQPPVENDGGAEE